MLFASLVMEILRKKRNFVTHGGPKLPLYSLMETLKRTTISYSAAVGIYDSPAKWLPPPPEFIKINVDVAVRLLFSVTAALARNADGTIIGMITEKWSFANDPAGEAHAILTAISLARTLLMSTVIIESDASQIINSPPPWAASGAVQQAKTDLRYFQTWEIVWISRKTNFAAHNLAKWAASSNSFGYLNTSSVPVDAFSDLSECYY